MATQSSILAWKIQWTEELGRLRSMGVFLAARAFSICGERRLLFSCTLPAFHYGGFSHCGARALGILGFSALTHMLSSCGSQALEHRLNSCGSEA